MEICSITGDSDSHVYFREVREEEYANENTAALFTFCAFLCLKLSLGSKCFGPKFIGENGTINMSIANN